MNNDVWFVERRWFNIELYSKVPEDKRCRHVQRDPVYVTNAYEKAIDWIKNLGKESASEVYKDYFTVFKLPFDSQSITNPTHVEHFDREGNKLVMEPIAPKELPKTSKGAPPYSSVSG